MVQTPEINQRVHHATDEEKLASTGVKSRVTDIQEEKAALDFEEEPLKTLSVVDLDGEYWIVIPGCFWMVVPDFVSALPILVDGAIKLKVNIRS